MRLDTIYRFEEKALKRTSASGMWNPSHCYPGQTSVNVTIPRGDFVACRFPGQAWGQPWRFCFCRPAGARESAHSVTAIGILMPLVFRPLSEKYLIRETPPSPFPALSLVRPSFLRNPGCKVIMTKLYISSYPLLKTSECSLGTASVPSLSVPWVPLHGLSPPAPPLCTPGF